MAVSSWLRRRPLRTQLARDGKPEVLEWSYEPAWWLGSGTTLGLIAILSIALIPALQGVWHRDSLNGEELPLFVNEARRTVLPFWGGIVVVIGLYFAWQRMLATEEANRLERDRFATERFANAVEKLGHDDIADSVRRDVHIRTLRPRDSANGMDSRRDSESLRSWSNARRQIVSGRRSNGYHSPGPPAVGASRRVSSANRLLGAESASLRLFPGRFRNCIARRRTFRSQRWSAPT